ncbi:MAG: hypothetical protein M1823_004644 [Watsoniomyces obsoletus]|nr:MAG: hypothetical protein M1823_004644 [Watsoniomyces obsoletus]
MASQDGEGVPIAFSYAQQEFRLLELPPKVLDLITSDAKIKLFVKSPETPAGSSSSPGANADRAVFCAGVYTYHLRQLHSSNSMLVVRPQLISSIDDRPGISVIGSPKSTLELHEADVYAGQYLDDVLAWYHGPGVEEGDVTGLPSSSTVAAGRTKEKIIAGIPVSDEECERSWWMMCAFEDGNVAYQPTPLALTRLWASLCTALSSEGQAIDGSLERAGLWELIRDEGYPQPLLEAMMARISTDRAPSDTGKRAIQP